MKTKTKNVLSILLITLILIMNLNSIYAVEDTGNIDDNSNKICAVYFSSVNCVNCAVTDPKVLGEWPGKYKDLIVIDYEFADWTDVNAKLLGKYAEKFESLAGTPNLFIGNKNFVGRIDVLDSENTIKQITNSNCLLLDSNVSFKNLDLNNLPEEPKIWANNRVLIKIKNSDVSNDFLKQLLSEDINETIANSSYNIVKIKAKPVEISDGEIDFKYAIKIEDSWMLEFNDDNVDVDIPDNTNSTPISIFGWEINPESGSLILTAILIAVADGFNPCAFFILTFLLATILYAGGEEEDKKKKRKRILLVGGVFVLFSAVIYFLFMGLWLNVFLYAKQIIFLTLVAGIIAIFAGIINIKDYFFFQKGLSFTLSKKERFKFINKVEKLTQVKALPALIFGTIVVAISVNMYELLCTFGFPMVFLRILTLNDLTGFAYYSYVGLYCLFYVLPLIIIVSVFAYTLGKKEFSKDNIRRFKLISGFMVLFLGLILIFNPHLLENISASFIIIGIAILISFIIIGFNDGLIDVAVMKYKKRKMDKHLSRSEKEADEQVEKLVDESE